MEDLSKKFASEVGDQTETADSPTRGLIHELDTTKQQAIIYNYRQNTAERKKYADLIFQFTCGWCIIVVVIIFGCGRDVLHLSDLILTTLIGSTTLNVFGFFLLVTKYLFNETKST